VQAGERASGRFVAVGFQDYYDPGTRWLAEELGRGAIGEVRSVRFLGIWPRPRSYYLRNNWAGRLQVDGVAVLDSPLNNAFGHFVMLSLLFSGAMPDDIVPLPNGVELWRAHAIESFDTAVVTLRTRHGVRLWFGASHASHTPIEPAIMIEGTAGTAGWRYEKEAWFEPAAGGRQSRPVLDQQATRSLMMAAVQQRLRDPAAAICSTGMAARHTSLIEGIHRAAPIREFPRARVGWAETDGPASAVPAVPGLDAALRRAFAEQRSLRDSGFTLAEDPKAR
jgi:predicted dehydrogenase